MVFFVSNTFNSSYLGKFLKEEQISCCFINNAKIPYKGCLRKIEDWEWQKQKKIISSLEDSHELIKKNFPSNLTVKNLEHIKNKFLFRETLKKLYPNFKYELTEHATYFDLSTTFENPKVAKPIYGIASQGVISLKNIEHTNENRYLHIPRNYIIEDYIDGTELAIDGYYDSSGMPIVLNIMQHDFKHDNDVSDSMYYTNYSLVEKHRSEIIELLYSLNNVFWLTNFPFHLEVRFTKDKKYIPIEINPYRFSGYGTCEIADYAYGINPYKSYYKDIEPDWSKIGNTIPGKEKKSNFGFVTFESDNEKLDHYKISSMFEELLEYRFIHLPNSKIKSIVFFKESNPQRLSEYLKIV